MTQQSNPLKGFVTFHMRRRTLAATSLLKRIFNTLMSSGAVPSEYRDDAAALAAYLSHCESVEFADGAAEWLHPELIAIRDFWAWWQGQPAEFDGVELWRWRFECLGEVTIKAWDEALDEAQFTALHNPRSLHPPDALTSKELQDSK